MEQVSVDGCNKMYICLSNYALASRIRCCLTISSTSKCSTTASAPRFSHANPWTFWLSRNHPGDERYPHRTPTNQLEYYLAAVILLLHCRSGINSAYSQY